MIEKFNEKTHIEIIETNTLRPKLMVNWIKGEYSGYKYSFEGSVKNVGKISLTGVHIEIKSYDPDGNLIDTQAIPLYPETITPGELGHFKDRVYLKGMTLRTYTYKFISESGEEISYTEKNKDK